MSEPLIENKESNEYTIIEIPLIQHANQVGEAIPVVDIIPEPVNEPVCRICNNGLQIEGQIPTPLISPCMCEGFVHHKCIVNYLNNTHKIHCNNCTDEYNMSYEYFDKHGAVKFWDLFWLYIYLQLFLVAYCSSFMMLFVWGGTGSDNAGYKYLFCVCGVIGTLNLLWIINLFMYYNDVKIVYNRLFGYKNKVYFALYIFCGFFCSYVYVSISKDHTRVVRVFEREIQN